MPVKKLRRKHMEFELDDILEECAITFSYSQKSGITFCDKTITDNIEYALKNFNEEIMNTFGKKFNYKDDYVIIPAGGDIDFVCEKESSDTYNCSWIVDFEVFDNTTRDIKFTGEALVKMYCRKQDPSDEDSMVCDVISISGVLKDKL